MTAFCFLVALFTFSVVIKYVNNSTVTHVSREVEEYNPVRRFLLFIRRLSSGKNKRKHHKGCNILLTSGGAYSPLLVSRSNFIYPKYERDVVTIEEDKTIRLACSGSKIEQLDNGHDNPITATCSKGNFRSDSKIIKPETLKCKQEPRHSARYTNRSCESNGKEIEIGFAINKKTFNRLILVCFDMKNKMTLYTLYELSKAISSRQSASSKPSFKEDEFYNLDSDVNSLYKKKDQRTHMNRLLGLPANSKKYVKDDGKTYLARGHLTANADFIYISQQKATYYYANVAPQWQSFNNGNWKAAEIATRNLATQKKADMKVYTGTYGVTALPHAKTNRSTPLYLYANGNKKAIPVPKLYWKVIYEPKEQLGIALVGVNNPFLTELGNNKICEDISSEVPWFKWKAHEFERGYSYACSVPDLRDTVGYVPRLNVKGLLI